MVFGEMLLIKFYIPFMNSCIGTLIVRRSNYLGQGQILLDMRIPWTNKNKLKAPQTRTIKTVLRTIHEFLPDLT